jgi:hypothetical protein
MPALYNALGALINKVCPVSITTCQQNTAAVKLDCNFAPYIGRFFTAP